MARTYTYACSLEWGGDTPTAVLDDIVVTYSVDWGCPYSRDTAPEAATVIDIEIVSIDGVAWADWDGGYAGRAYWEDEIVNKLEMDREDQMIEAATEEEVPE
jgi:hypothetical protein